MVAVTSLQLLGVYGLAAIAFIVAVDFWNNR